MFYSLSLPLSPKAQGKGSPGRLLSAGVSLVPIPGHLFSHSLGGSSTPRTLSHTSEHGPSKGLPQGRFKLGSPLFLHLFPSPNPLNSDLKCHGHPPSPLQSHDICPSPGHQLISADNPRVLLVSLWPALSRPPSSLRSERRQPGFAREKECEGAADIWGRGCGLDGWTWAGWGGAKSAR